MQGAVCVECAQGGSPQRGLLGAAVGEGELWATRRGACCRCLLYFPLLQLPHFCTRLSSSHTLLCCARRPCATVCCRQLVAAEADIHAKNNYGVRACVGAGIGLSCIC